MSLAGVVRETAAGARGDDLGKWLVQLQERKEHRVGGACQTGSARKRPATRFRSSHPLLRSVRLAPGPQSRFRLFRLPGSPGCETAADRNSRGKSPKFDGTGERPAGTIKNQSVPEIKRNLIYKTPQPRPLSQQA